MNTIQRHRAIAKIIAQMHRLMIQTRFWIALTNPAGCPLKAVLKPPQSRR